MLIAIAYVLAGLVAAGIIFIGLREIWAPEASAGFGIPGSPVEDRTFQAWLSVKAVRDIASGLFILIVMIGASHQLLGWFLLAGALIPGGDAVIVLRSKGPKAIAYGVHGATAVVMLVAGLLAFAA